MSDKSKELSKYRLEQAKETLGVAKLCYETGHYKDAINRACIGVNTIEYTCDENGKCVVALEDGTLVYAPEHFKNIVNEITEYTKDCYFVFQGAE